MHLLASAGGRRQFIAAWLIGMSISHVVLAAVSLPLLRRGYQDFTIFYAAGKLVRTGQVADLYNPAVQYRVQQAFAPQAEVRHGALPYTHTPFEALLYVPLTFLPFPAAYSLWVAVNLVLLILGLNLLRRNFDEVNALTGPVLGLVAAGFFPVAVALIQGQDTIVALFLIVLAMVCMKKSHDARAGAILGLALFKFHLVGPLALLVAVRRPRLLLGLIPAGIAVASVSVVLVGWNGMLHYANYLVDLEGSGAQGAIVSADMANLRGLLTLLPGLEGIPLLATIVACSLALLAVISWGIWKNSDSIFRVFACAATAAVLVSYHALPYDLVLLLPAGILLLSGLVRGGERLAPRVLLCFLLFLTPLDLALWLHWRVFCGFAVLLLWLLWELSRPSSLPEPVPLTARYNTTPSMGK